MNSRILRVSATLICALLVMKTQPVFAATFNLYERVKDAVTKETMVGEADVVLPSYIAKFMKWESVEVKSGAVEDALEQKEWDFCASLPPEKGGTFQSCPDINHKIQELAQKTERIRALGRDLLSLASGYEVGIDGFMGEPVAFSDKLAGILRIWGSTIDQLFTPMKIPSVRAAALPNAVKDDLFSALDTALTEEGEVISRLTDEGGEGKKLLIPAVWRYRYGIANFGEPCSETDGNAELHELTVKRYCNVERALRDILNAIPQDTNAYSPPLRQGEIIVFPPQALESASHVLVWMKIEVENGKVIPDVGLNWDLALDPVLPGLQKSETAPDCMGEIGNRAYCDVVEDLGLLPGGLYPDPPEEPELGRGICNIPFAHAGYLCRTMDFEGCDQELDKDPLSIALSKCDPEWFHSPTRMTQSGPDLCGEGWWRTPIDSTSAQRDTAGEDPDLRPDVCSNCVVDVYCSESCKMGDEGGDGYTDVKNTDGVIKICLSNKIPHAGLPFLLIHELAHAQQFCKLLPEQSIIYDAESCCATEHEAYLVSCHAEAEGGFLEKLGVSVEECASGLANYSCEHFGGPNLCSEMGFTGIKKKFTNLFIDADRINPSAPSCEEFVNNLETLDARAISMKESLKNPCTPGCRTRYENTIGNNMCFTGQCIEQSIEESRIIPGRMAFTVQDESFPWDACSAQDPRFGSLLTLPAFSPFALPSYNPSLLAKSLDAALCQINGMPRRTPPVLCQFGSERRLEIPLADIYSTALSLTDQPTENLDPTEALQKMTQSIATRMGTDPLVHYLSWAIHELADTLKAANQLLTEMGKARFPTAMCPRNAANMEGLCDTFNQAVK